MDDDSMMANILENALYEINENTAGINTIDTSTIIFPDKSSAIKQLNASYRALESRARGYSPDRESTKTQSTPTNYQKRLENLKMKA